MWLEMGHSVTCLPTGWKASTARWASPERASVDHWEPPWVCFKRGLRFCLILLGVPETGCHNAHTLDRDEGSRGAGLQPQLMPREVELTFPSHKHS